VIAAAVLFPAYIGAAVNAELAPTNPITGSLASCGLGKSIRRYDVVFDAAVPTVVNAGIVTAPDVKLPGEIRYKYPVVW